MKSFSSVSIALSQIDSLAIGQRVEILARPAHVIEIHGSRTIQFNTSHQETTSRPDDGRRYMGSAEVSSQYQNS